MNRDSVVISVTLAGGKSSVESPGLHRPGNTTKASIALSILAVPPSWWCDRESVRDLCLPLALAVNVEASGVVFDSIRPATSVSSPWLLLRNSPAANCRLFDLSSPMSHISFTFKSCQVERTIAPSYVPHHTFLFLHEVGRRMLCAERWQPQLLPSCC